jgi:HEAT repeat protein
LFQGTGDPFRRWIDQLADDDPALREGAALYLRQAGKPAWTSLERAARAHPEAECRARAQDLLYAQRQRRRLSYAVLEEHPSALLTLEAGGTTEKIRLIRTLGRHFEESSELLQELLGDSDPDVVVAAAEALHENRNCDWSGRLLDLLALEDSPRSNRIFELLATIVARIQAADFQSRFDQAGPRARNRLMTLALHGNLALAVSAPTVRQMLRQGDVATRRVALSWIRDRGAAGNTFEVEPLLGAADPQVVADALTTLRQIRHRPDPAVLQGLLRHEDPGVREESALTVAGFEERECLPGLRRLLLDPSVSVRQAALNGLWKLGGASVLGEVLDVYLRDAGDQRELASSILMANRDRVILRVKDLTGDRDLDRRLRALELLARLEGPAVVFPMAADPNESIRRWALGQLLKRTEIPAVLDTLESLTGDPCETIRFESVRTLVRLGRIRHIPELEAFLSSAEYTFRFDAAETLLDQGGERTEPLARRLMSESDPQIRRLAMSALSDRADRRCVEEALDGLKDADGRLRRTAAHYLNKMLSTKRDRELVARLAATLQGSDGETLSLAFRLVMDYGDRGDLEAVRSLVLAGRAPNAERAVRALAEWAGEQATEELLRLLTDDGALNEIVFARLRELRKSALFGSSLRVEASLRLLLACPDSRVRRGAIEAAEEFGAASDLLVRMIDDPAASVRHSAIGACVRRSLQSAAPAIEKHLSDEDPEVRISSVAALHKLRPTQLGAIERAIADEECGWARRRMDLTFSSGSR